MQPGWVELLRWGAGGVAVGMMRDLQLITRMGVDGVMRDKTRVGR